ncbi:bifunctional riboflavin kinase/FAD synthetase [Actinotignum sp. GS-2025b]|uniref:bifunctional riboflavin kinase/FAD synthetase n=1 Tax=Actinotignum sp. GS-2025b TaxID=3427275 RepID=UPI003F470175
MQIWTSPSDISPDFDRSVVTFGVYDGVHRGHRAVLTRAVDIGRELGWPVIVLTFDPHPATVHRPEAHIRLVMSLQDRINRIETLGVDALYLQHYDAAYARATAAEFVRDQLVGQLRAGFVVVGHDARFGAGNTGDEAVLRSLSTELGFGVEIVGERCDAAGERWSSTRVRAALATGNVDHAAQILERPHRIHGTVVHGARRGRELGFPTANLSGDDLGEVPADGVYAGWLVRRVPGGSAEEYLPAAISVGTNPQFDGQERTVEAHVLGRSDLNLYGEPISIDFVSRIRPMLTFGSVDELLARIDLDVLETADRLGVPPAGRVPPGAVQA